MDKTILVTVVLKVPENISDRLKNIQQVLVSKYSPESTWFEPHITIHQIKCPEANLNKIIENIKKICANNQPLEIIPDGINIKGPYVGIAFKKTNQIEALHEKIVLSLNDLREGNIKSSYLEHQDQSSEEEWSNIQKYGYPHIFNLYKPHVALIKLDSLEQVPLASSDVVWKDSFWVDELQAVVMVNKEKKKYDFALGLIEK